MSDIVVFEARAIITLDRRLPAATHVAVRDGRILGVGSLDEVAGWGGYTLERQFRDHILTPGFVEGHAHMMTGGIWRYTYVGHMDRTDPKGRVWKAALTTPEVLARLGEAQPGLAADEPLIGWGLDPLFLPGERLSRWDLDTVSSTRPIAIFHSNGHLLTANSAALAAVGFDASTEAKGVLKQADGQPNGELQEFAAMMPVFRKLRIDIEGAADRPLTHKTYGEAARRTGVTTIADLGRSLSDADVDELLRFTGEVDCPIRLATMLMAHSRPTPDLIGEALRYRALSTDRLRLGGVKIIVDGSIQGYTAKMRWPGYYRGEDHGIWNIAPAQLDEQIDALNGAGIQIHVHTNGDEATEAALDAFEKALTTSPRRDHRHTLQHCQLADAAQFRRIKALGLCVNLFSNHLFYFGDKHYELTVGPDRAERMNAAATALANGVPLAIHSDTPVTPLGPLTTAWCAVNRLSESGRLLGPAERISAQEALHAITLGAAYTLKMDDKVGSIEVGKCADFAVLEENPLAVAPESIKDIAIAGTVSGGRPMLQSSL